MSLVRRPRAAIRDVDGERGSALVEFPYLSLMLLVPLIYLLIFVFLVQRAYFAASAAVRDAGRAYATADSDTEGRARAAVAARLAFDDQHIPDPPAPVVACTGTCFAPGSTVRVRVSYDVHLPLVGGVLFSRHRGAIPVSATHLVRLDCFRQGSGTQDASCRG